VGLFGIFAGVVPPGQLPEQAAAPDGAGRKLEREQEE
jgi:hypothetical protein